MVLSRFSLDESQCLISDWRIRLNGKAVIYPQRLAADIFATWFGTHLPRLPVPSSHPMIHTLRRFRVVATNRGVV